MTPSKRMHYSGIDRFRLLAAILVVAIHTSPLTDVNTTADFILTRILARAAVPFFFMASGAFLFTGPGNEKRSPAKLMKFLKRTALLYGIAAFLYLPLNFYTGTTADWLHFPRLLSDVVFNGTFYHLWYLPAAILGACIVFILRRFISIKTAFGVTLLLYIAGLLGDSYYGFIENIPLLSFVYKGIFQITEYTRNGLFFAPIFLLLGALALNSGRRLSLRTSLWGLAASLFLMLTEGLLLHQLGVQRHDSMYMALPLLMFFLFQCLLYQNGKSPAFLRPVSMLIYLIHPAVIVIVRGFAKATGLEPLLIDNSLLHFFAVAFISFFASAAAIKLKDFLSGKASAVKGFSL